MAEKKYGQYVKPLVFKDNGPGSYRQGMLMDSDFLGMDARIEFGAYWAAGKMGGKSTGPHTHDYNQLMFWFGGDTSDMGELGAEVELCLGPEPEKHMITSSTAVYVPAGFPHFPANIIRMDKRFIFMTVSCSGRYQETPVELQKNLQDVQPSWMFFAKYTDRVIQAPFLRKGAWSYGPSNTDDGGGHLAAIRGTLFDTMIMCESLKKAPYRFGPDPEKPHAHTQPEILIFMGADTSDLSILGAEVEFVLGKEEESHIITTPTAVIVPAGFAHCPLTILKIDKPFILCDVRPFGPGVPNAKSM
ncbi:MAG: hypothetical protein JXA46_05410 [Dehalococcoidales bacterium]|nr:hypothetical protein [Dehalococcoidales bacterium]